MIAGICTLYNYINPWKLYHHIINLQIDVLEKQFTKQISFSLFLLIKRVKKGFPAQWIFDHLHPGYLLW